MNVITISEFKSNQTHFLEMAKKGVDIVLKSRLLGNFRIVPVASTDDEEVCTSGDIPNKETADAIKEARKHASSIRDGKEIAEKVDLTSVEAMLKSCGV